MPTAHRPGSAEDGFTLVELLVSMTLMIVVLLAVLMTLDVFGSTAAQQTRSTDANDRVRVTVDDTVRELRSAAQLLRAAPNDLVYATPASASSTRYRRVCLGADGRLYADLSTTTSDPGTACPSVAAGWTSSALSPMPSRNDASRPLFDYDGASSSATPGTVRAVGITVGLDASGGGRTGSSTLRAGAVVRRTAGMLPVDDGDVDVACTPTGAQIRLDAGLPGLLGALTVSYAADGGMAFGTGLGAVAVPQGVTTVVATITDALGVTRTIKKDATCT